LGGNSTIVRPRDLAIPSGCTVDGPKKQGGKKRGVNQQGERRKFKEPRGTLAGVQDSKGKKRLDRRSTPKERGKGGVERGGVAPGEVRTPI